MNILKRITNSLFGPSHFRWPSARTLRFYWYLVALTGLGTTIESGVHVYHHAISSGTANPGFIALAASLVNLFAWSFFGLFVLFMWGLLYRMGTEFVAGFRQFRAWLPGAWQSLGRAASAVINAICSIPALIGRFFRALGRAFLWLAGRPAWWCGLTRKQKVRVFTGIGTIGVYAGILVRFYPVARHISAASPSWMFMSDAPLLQTLCIDMFLGCLIGTLVVALIGIIFDLAAHLFSKN
jgi:hypothetical protein